MELENDLDSPNKIPIVKASEWPDWDNIVEYTKLKILEYGDNYDTLLKIHYYYVSNWHDNDVNKDKMKEAFSLLGDAMDKLKEDKLKEDKQMVQNGQMDKETSLPEWLGVKHDIGDVVMFTVYADTAICLGKIESIRIDISRDGKKIKYEVFMLKNDKGVVYYNSTDKYTIEQCFVRNYSELNLSNVEGR